MSFPNVKICGITRTEDAQLAIELGAWALGFIFYRKSSRALDPRVARSITQSLPKEKDMIGVFVDASIAELTETFKLSGLTGLQLHGDESPEFCLNLKQRLPEAKIIKAFRIREKSDLKQLSSYSMCDALLLDAFHPNLHGGTGRTFDWSLSESEDLHQGPPLILSGGINSANAMEAIQRFQPLALDVSSGIEKRPGIKDQTLLHAFFNSLQTHGKTA